MATIELNDDTLYTSPLPAGSRLFGAQSAAASEPTSFGREAIYNYVSAALSPVASSGSATDLTSGTLPLGRLHAHLADIASIASPQQGDLLYFNGSDFVALNPGTSGQVLVTNGSSANPSWQTVTSVAVGGLAAANNLSDVTNVSTARTNLGLAIGTNVQAWDAQLDSLSGASANGVSLVTAADYAAMRALLDLEAGTDFLAPAAIAAAYQPLDADLTTLAGLSKADGNFIVADGSAWTVESGATARASLGLASTTTDDAVVRYNGVSGATQNSGVTISDDNDMAGVRRLTASHADYAARFVNTQDAASFLEVARFEGDRATPTDGDSMQVGFYLSNDAGTQIEAARMTWTLSDVSAGTEDSALLWMLQTGGSPEYFLRLEPTTLSPASNNLIALGSTSVGWADLHLATGGVINWANGEVTLTETDANTLTLAGAVLVAGSGLQLSSGSASSPSLAPSGDTNTGIWFPSADTLKIGTGGAQSISIDTDRSVLVGDETSPNAAFNVATSPTFGGSDWIAWFRHEGSAANNESLIRHEHFSNTQTPLPIITGIANRGTIASRSAVQTNDYLFVLDGRGYDGSATDWTEYTAGISDTAAQIAFRAAENWSGSAHGAKITFTTVAIGATTATLRWTLNDTGGWSANGVTGGDKGAGTINATNLYVDNVAALTVNNLSTATAGQLGYYSGTHTVAGSGNFTVSGSTMTVGQAGVALGGLALAGSTSGNTTLQPAAAASGTLTLPAATDTLVGRATTDTLTNKTLTSPTMTTPTLGAASATSVANAAGSASAPSYTFTGDTNTGMYSPGADQVAIAVGGAQHLLLSASTLALPGSSSASTVLSATSSSTTASHRGDIQFYRNNNGSAISNGWWVGTFNFFGYDGATNLGAANFACVVDGAVSSGVVPLKMQFQTGSNSSPSTTLTLTSGGSVVCGNAALSTSATDGFLYIPTCAGTPSGTPTAQTGRVAIVFDTTNNKLCVYDGGWLQTVALT